MKKNSGFMQAFERIRQQDRRDVQFFTRQLVQDCACIALNRFFGFGADRLDKFRAELGKAYDEVADLWNADCKDREYAIAKIDECLKEICGEHFAPWDERYNGYYINAKGELRNRHE